MNPSDSSLACTAAPLHPRVTSLILGWSNVWAIDIRADRQEDSHMELTRELRKEARSYDIAETR